MTTTKTSFSQALASGRPVLTAECVPPHSGDPEAVKKVSALLPSSLDAVVVADNPDEIHGSALACAALMALSLLVLPLLRVKNLELTAEQLTETKGFKLSNYIEPRTVPIGVALMLAWLCYSSVSSFLALYSEKAHLTAAAGVFFIVYAVVVFFTRPIVGRRFDAKGENSVMYAAILVFALGLAILAIATHGSVLLLSAAVMGLGFGTIQACGRALMIKVTPLHRMGQATSTFYLFGDTGLGVGPLLCGLLIPVTGYRGMYGIMAGVAVAAVVIYHALHGRRADTYAVERLT